jgi:tetratricopeptide (TPR) repeat protein
MQQGDAFVSEERYTPAQKAYSDAIQVTAPATNDLLILWNKRAVAFMKQRKYTEALKDCVAAIGLAHDNMKIKTINSPLMKKISTTIEEQLIKALFCKAQILEITKKYKAAILVYEDILPVNPSYKEKVAECISRCKKQIPDPVKELRERERKLKEEEAQRLAKEQQINEKISSWIGGREWDFKALVCSLEMILWPEVYVKNSSLNSSSSPKDFKKLYFKVIAKVHPDKVKKTRKIIIVL